VKILSKKPEQVKPEKKSKGFFLVPRDVSRLPYFNENEKKYTRYRALLYLIDHAIFKTQEIELERQGRKIKIKVNRNEVFTSRLILKEHWKRSLKWIDRFLSELEEKKLIDKIVVRTALKTEKRDNALGQRKNGKKRQRKTRKIAQLGIRVKLLFLDDLDEDLRRLRINRILEKRDNAKNEKRDNEKRHILIM